MKHFQIAILSIAVFLSQSVVGDSVQPAILTDANVQRENYLPDFSYAGYRNGNEQLPIAQGTVIHVADFGAVADDGRDDSRALLAALAKAHTIDGPVIVRLAPGRFRVTEVLKIERGDLVLQGAGPGPGGTTLFFPRPLKHVDKSSSLDELRRYLTELDKRQEQPELNLDEYFSEYSWSGGLIWIQKPGTRPAAYLEEFDPEITPLAQVLSARRGDKQLQTSTPSGIKAGDIVQVQWINRDGPEGGIVKSLYASAHELAGSHHWSFPERPLVRQTSRVRSVSENTLVLDDPLLHDVSEAIPAQISSWDGLQHVGIEGLHIEFPNAPWFGHHIEQGYNGIYFTTAFDSWVRNVRFSNADSGILSYSSANLTFSDIVSDGNRRAHYAVHMGNVHNVLAENLTILNPVLHSLTFNTQSTKCVYKRAQVLTTPTLDQHAGANHQNLYDNVTLHMRAQASEDGKAVVAFDGSGAGYWQPGHGGFNTTWNLRILVTGGAYPDETVTVLGTDEGPMARIVGLHGNRKLKLDYRPAPYVEALNVALDAAPSLYDYQLSSRLSSRQQ